MASSPLSRPRILLLGLCDPSCPDGGLGVYLAKALRPAFRDVEVVEAPPAGPNFSGLLRDFDAIIVLDSIPMWSGPGRVLVVSPYALAGLKEDRAQCARILDDALHDARLLGHRIPSVDVVAVCVPESKGCSSDGGPGLAALYRAVVPHVKQVVKELVAKARLPSAGAVEATTA